MSRYKTFNSTGLAPDGRLYAGDLNAIQDRYADLSGNYSQTIDTGVVRYGDSSIQLLKYGTGEARLTASLRTDGIVRALGGLFAGQYTTAERDAISSVARPFGVIIFNTTTLQYEYNAGTDIAPAWRPLGIDPTNVFNFIGSDSELTFRNEDNENNPIIRAAVLNEISDRLVIRVNGTYEMGPGGSAARDVKVYRGGPDIWKTDDNVWAALNVRARDGNANAQVEIGDGGPSNKAGIVFGSAGDSIIFRDSAGQMRTIGDFSVGSPGVPSVFSPFAMNTAQRDALAVGRRPEGGIIFNTDTRALEENVGSDASPLWAPVSDPVGSLMFWPYAFGNVPAGYERGDGTAISRATFGRLHTLAAAAAYPDGNGDGSTTFNKPDYRGRMLLGLDNMGTGAAGRVTSASTGGENAANVGGTGGSQTHTLTESQLSPHSHVLYYYIEHVTGTYSGSPSGADCWSVSTWGNFAAYYSVSPGVDGYSRPYGIQPSGGTISQPHNNMPPWKACHILIRAR